MSYTCERITRLGGPEVHSLAPPCKTLATPLNKSSHSHSSAAPDNLIRKGYYCSCMEFTLSVLRIVIPYSEDTKRYLTYSYGYILEMNKINKDYEVSFVADSSTTNSNNKGKYIYIYIYQERQKST